jgi:hypothetical protein
MFISPAHGLPTLNGTEHTRYCGLFSGLTWNTWCTLQPKLLDNYYSLYVIYKCGRAPHNPTAARGPQFRDPCYKLSICIQNPF